MNVPETFQVDPEQWEVALKEIQFPHLWYSMTKDKNHYIGCYNTARGHSSNKRVDFKFMKEVKHGYYLSMSEIVAEVNAKIIKVPKTINLHSDGFDICFDYDSFSNKSIVTHGVSKWMDQTCLCEWDSRRMKFCVDLCPLYPYL